MQVDEAGGTFAAVEHLTGLGHRRIMLVAGTLRFPNDRLKLEGYRRALARHGLEYDPKLVVEHWEGDMRGVQRSLAAEDRPTAAAVNDDMITLDVISAAKELGLRIPEDLAVVSFGDYLLHSFVKPALTTISLPIERMGEVAADMLFGQIRGGDIEQRVVMFEAQLTVRESCGTRLPPSGNKPSPERKGRSWVSRGQQKTGMPPRKTPEENR
ncbi:MAG: hypothetical protein A2147_04780 [Chloroflexi bacterium RBG_16_57_8]|nr:MAG: hypothetical protein A2147_04780 [Chloroflexi bacterium RBG_16_57_8]